MFFFKNKTKNLYVRIMNLIGLKKYEEGMEKSFYRVLLESPLFYLHIYVELIC